MTPYGYGYGKSKFNQGYQKHTKGAFTNDVFFSWAIFDPPPCHLFSANLPVFLSLKSPLVNFG